MGPSDLPPLLRAVFVYFQCLGFSVMQFQKTPPCRSAAVSNRAMRRRSLRFSRWRLANDFIATCQPPELRTRGQEYFEGTQAREACCGAPCGRSPLLKWYNDHVSQSHARFHCVTLREASRLRTARREAFSNEVPLTGAQCVAKLIKGYVIYRYSYRTKAHAQGPMRALDIGEPPRVFPVVDMLEALPPEEREYYAHEDNVLDWCAFP